MTDPDHDLIPVDLQGNHYLVSANWVAAGLDFPPRAQEAVLLEQGYRRREGRVHLDGRSRPATILLSPDGDDQAFAVITPEAPASEDAEDGEIAPASPDELERFWEETHSRFGRAEGVLPEQRAEILSAFVEPRLSVGEDSALVPWDDVRRSNYLLVSGAPGSGKTTLLRHWLLWHADRGRLADADVLPISLSLRDYRPDVTIEIALRREAEAIGATWLSRDFKAYASKGRLAVALDGVDELASEDRSLAMLQITAFTEEYPYCRYLVTTRPEVPVDLKVGLKRARILPFDQSRVRQMAYHRLYETGTWKTFTCKVEAEPALDWVISNPLALSFLMARYVRREIAPSYVGEIVGAVIDLFIDTWDASRGIVRTRERALSPAEKRKILSQISLTDGQHPLQLAGEARTLADHSDLYAMLNEHTGLLLRDEERWVFRSAVVEEFFRAIDTVSSLGSRASQFRALLKKPLDVATSQMARFIGFISSDAGDQIDGVLKSTPADSLPLAVHLTDVLSQGMTIKPSILDAYAAYVASTLEAAVKSHASVSSPNPGISSVTLTRRASAEMPLHELVLLLHALHRARDSLSARSLQAALSGRSEQLDELSRLIHADGELKVTQSDEAATLQVTEIMPEVANGPAAGG